MLKHTIPESFFQHGNNSGKRDTVAFQGACIECNMSENVFFVSQVINRRRAPIAKSPIFFVSVSPLSMYM